MWINGKFVPIQAEENGGDPPAGSGGGNSDPGDLGDAGKKAIEAERRRVKQLEAQLKTFQEKYAGLDPEELEMLRKEKELADQRKLEEEKKYGEALTLAQQKHQKELQAIAQQKADYENRYQSMVIESQVIDAFFEAGGKRGTGEGTGPKSFAKLLLPQIQDRLKVIEGEVVVVDSNGNPAFNTKTGKDYTLADLMLECRQGATGILFEPVSNASGAGANGSNRMSGSRQSDAMKQLEGLHGSARLGKARELGLIN